MAEETPGQIMARNAKRLYADGIEATKAWHGRLTEDRAAKLKGGINDDHKRGAVSPLGGDGWWRNGA